MSFLTYTVSGTNLCSHPPYFYTPKETCPICFPSATKVTATGEFSTSDLLGRISDLELRMAALEERLAIHTKPKPLTPTGMFPRETHSACPKCGSQNVKTTGNILTSMPPQTEYVCREKGCGHLWGVVDSVWGSFTSIR